MVAAGCRVEPRCQGVERHDRLLDGGAVRNDFGHGALGVTERARAVARHERGQRRTRTGQVKQLAFLHRMRGGAPLLGGADATVHVHQLPRVDQGPQRRIELEHRIACTTLRCVVITKGVDHHDHVLEVAELIEERLVALHEGPVTADQGVGVGIERQVQRAQPAADHGQTQGDPDDDARRPRGSIGGTIGDALERVQGLISHSLASG